MIQSKNPIPIRRDGVFKNFIFNRFLRAKTLDPGNQYVTIDKPPSDQKKTEGTRGYSSVG
ncbi:MAG: hypothetical protein Q8O95_06395 [bacterium]|nr:hypothetical protein [bacterium]